MRRLLVVVGASLLIFSTGVRAVAPAGVVGSVTPALQQALDDLSSGDYASRHKALEHLKASFAQQAVVIASQNDPEAQADLSIAVEFNEGLMRWVDDLLKSPPESQERQMKFVSDPQSMPILAKLFAKDTTTRVAGVKALGALKGPGADGLLARMIADDDRVVALAAMEVAWDCAPSPEVVDALWNRGVQQEVKHRLEAGLNGDLPLLFRGEQVPGGFTDRTPLSRYIDNEAATNVLVHLQPPQVNAKLTAFLKEAAFMVGKPEVTEAQLLVYGTAYPQNLYPSLHNLYKLVHAFKPKEIVPYLYPLATCKVVQTSPYPDGHGNLYFASNRTFALAALVVVSGQNPDDYHLKHRGELWLSTSARDENDAIAKLKEWWGQQQKTASVGP